MIALASALALSGLSLEAAPMAWASVCQSDGMSCTASGSYPGLNELITSDYAGFQVVWTSSKVQPYSSGVPTSWTVRMTYTNNTSSDGTLTCPGQWVNASFVTETMTGGSGDDGKVPAASTTCSQNPGLNVTVPPGGTFTSSATFHNVPWPGSTVAIKWGDAGSSPSITPWICPQISTPTWSGYVACGVNAFSVTARWAVPPAISDGKRNSGAGFWVGLGGITGSLEQTGTASDMVNGSPLYFAFYELTPAGPVRLANTIRPGDIMSATVSLSGSDRYHFALTDNGPAAGHRKWTFSKAVTYSKGSHDSGEAIAEWSSGRDSCVPPGCALTDFSSVAFSGVKIGGYTVGSYHPGEYHMYGGRVSVSSVRKGTDYTVLFRHT